MTKQRLALIVIAGGFLIAETVAPTHWQPKRISHATSVALSGASLDETVLDSIPPIARLALGSIDVMQVASGAQLQPLTSKTPVPINASIVLIGWAGDPVARAAPGGAFVSIDNRQRIDISRNFTIRRVDVVKYYDAPGLIRSGFRAVIPARSLGGGTHELQFGIIAEGGRGFYPLAGPIDITVE